MVNQDQPVSSPQPLAGLLFLLFGLLPVLGFFGIGPLTSDQVNGPPWLGLAAGGIFVAAGLALMLGNRAERLTEVLALAIIGGLASIGNWIAFGAGERVCGGSISLPFIANTGEFSDLACRLPFGFGAMVVNAILLLAMANLLRKTLGGPPKAAGLIKLSQWLLLVALTPLLLPLLLLLVAQSILESVRTRLVTGAWPRNGSFLRRMSRKAKLR
jgi:hypothetical protein